MSAIIFVCPTIGSKRRKDEIKSGDKKKENVHECVY
jgi:hypothetical protein